MACRRSMEYVTALATIAMALALIAFAISVTNLNRNNRERKENNDAMNATTEKTINDRNGKENENDSETQLLIGTTTTKNDLIIKPTELSAIEKLDKSTTTATAILSSSSSPLSSSSTTEESVHIVLPTIKPVLNPVTSNNILPVDDDVDDAVVIDNHYSEVSTTTITSAIDPSTIEVI